MKKIKNKKCSFSRSKFLQCLFGGVIVALVIIYLTLSLDAQQIHKQSLPPSLPARSGTRTVTVDWLLELPAFSYERPSVQWIDNTRLVYVFPSSIAKQAWEIKILDLSTGEEKTLIEGSVPKPSPDGQWIAFAHGEDQEKQLWIISTKGTDLKQLSQIQGGLGIYDYSYTFAWSPDSKQIALQHQLFVDPGRNPQPNQHPAESKIDLIDITSGHCNSIASLDASIRDLSWMPNGKQILFMKERLGQLYNIEEDHTWIQSVDTNDGKVHTIAHFDGLQQSLEPTISPDERFVAFMYDADNPMFTFMLSIGVISMDSVCNDTLRSINRLTHEMQLRKPKWTNNSQHIYALRKLGAYSQIYTFDIKSEKPTQITHAALGVQDYALSPDNTQLAWIGRDAHGSHVLCTANSNGENVRDLITLLCASNDMALGEVREIEWDVPNYPVPMRGLLFLPLNYQEGIRYPLIIDIHGGGGGASIGLRGGILVSTPFEWHMWTAKGYAVFVPEFRSSASFGSLAITRDYLQEHDELNCDIIDINAGVDKLIEQGIVDSDRLAVIGHSAGGARANWLTVATHRYRAVISNEGWADAWTASLMMNTRMKRAELIFGGAPWEVPQNYLKNSALYHAFGATTPTLFLMGNPKLGGVDPAGTVRMLYNALHGQGIETEYIEYPDEGHSLVKLDNRRHALLKSIQWIDEHIGEKCLIE